MATLISTFVNANRDPKKSQAAKPSDFFYFDFGQGSEYTAAISNTFFSLAADRKLPGWLFDHIPVQELRKLKTSDPVFKPRAWQAKPSNSWGSKGISIFLINPRLHGKTCLADLAVISEENLETDQPKYNAILQDVDAQLFYAEILVPVYETPETIILDAQFELVSNGLLKP